MQLSNDLRIEKRRLAVAVTLMSGVSLDGELFAQASEHYHGDVEDAPEILNSADPFFPLAVRNGETILVAKDNVQTVAIARSTVHEDAALSVPTRVEVGLRDGDRLSGTILVDPASGRTRLLDFLNRRPHRFIALYGRESVLLINRALLERVRPL